MKKLYNLINKRSFSKKNDKLVFGLLKNSQGDDRIKTDDEAELDANTSFEVLSLLQKNKDSRRFSIRHRRTDCDDDYINRKDEIDKEEEEIKHKAPQHRRYLVHPTIGPGTPYQRDKMKQSQRMNKAAVNTVKYQREKLGIIDDDTGSNLLTRNSGSQMASEIEDKIQLSILKGDFDNLKNSGKPLDKYHNPLVDRTTDLAFEILKKNGITPDWINLQNQVYGLKEDLRARIKIEWCRFLLSTGVEIKNVDEKDLVLFTNKTTHIFLEDEKLINTKTDAYNLIVPSHFLTRSRFNLELEIKEATKLKFTSVNGIDEMLSNQIEISNSYEHIRIASRFDMSTLQNDISRPIYYRNNGSSTVRYNGSHERFDDKTISPGDLTLMFFMKPIENITNFLLKNI